MDKEQNREEVDALCPECGHAFKTFVDRLFGESEGVPTDTVEAECPVCGCGECRIGK